MRIAIDGMGGDHAPEEIVLGAIEAAKQNPEARLLLVGQKDRLARSGMPANLEIVHASQVVEMKEEPVKALRSKRDSSLRVAMTLVKQGS
ncbi:MAG TPA: phosphate--acyl-ACP acyltransferase, partial [Planctomycetota bacterium]|nr:phosphate--acyl-ACP acyltransferase [Planctomycetota bacterium]